MRRATVEDNFSRLDDAMITKAPVSTRPSREGGCIVGAIDFCGAFVLYNQTSTVLRVSIAYNTGLGHIVKKNRNMALRFDVV